MKLGKNQLEMLTVLGCPGRFLVVPDKLSDSMVKRGLLHSVDGFVCITPAGLRALADAVEAGTVKQQPKAQQAAA